MLSHMAMPCMLVWQVNLFGFCNMAAAVRESASNYAGINSTQSHPFIDLPPEVGSALAMYNTFNNLVGIAGHVQMWRSSAKYTLGSNLMRNLDALRDVHDTLVSKLDLRRPDGATSSINDTCDGCSDEELKNEYKIYRPFSGGSAVAQIAFGSCEHRLKKAVAMMRRSIRILSHECNIMTQELAQATNLSEASFRRLSHRGCDADCSDNDCASDDAADAIMRTDLEEHGVGEASGSTGLCRELSKDMERDQVEEACQAQCQKLGTACAGYVLYNGTLTHHLPRRSELHSWSIMMGEAMRYGWDDIAQGDLMEMRDTSEQRTLKQNCHNLDIMADLRLRCGNNTVGLSCGETSLGCHEKTRLMLVKKVDGTDELTNKCCFRSSVMNEYTQEATTCFVRLPDDNLGGLTVEKTAEWVANIPLSGVAAELGSQMVKQRKLNGLAFGSLGKTKIKEYLGVANPNDVTLMLCMIDAAKNGADEGNCKQTSFLDAYKRIQGVVDPYIFFGLKTSLSTGYGLSALSRIVHRTKSYLRQYQWVADRAVQSIGMYLYYLHTSGAITTLSSQDWAAGQVDWIPVAASASMLVKTALANTWDTCAVVEKWLMETDIGDPDKLDRAVDAATRDA